MNKTVIIIGSVVLLGVGAYFYFKPKATVTTDAGSTGAGSTGEGTTSGSSSDAGTTGGGTSSGGSSSGGSSSGGSSSGGSSSSGTTLTPQQVLDKVKEDEAKGLATQIATLKIEKGILNREFNAMPISFGIKASERGILLSKINVLNKKINDLLLAIKKVGYKEVNGTAVKLVEVTTTTLV